MATIILLFDPQYIVKVAATEDVVNINSATISVDRTGPGGDWRVSIEDSLPPWNEAVAKSFVSITGGETNYFCDHTAFGPRAPEKLYFYLRLLFTLQRAGRPAATASLYFGAGDSSGSMNWWVGSPQLLNIKGGFRGLFTQLPEPPPDSFADGFRPFQPSRNRLKFDPFK